MYNLLLEALLFSILSIGSGWFAIKKAKQIIDIYRDTKHSQEELEFVIEGAEIIDTRIVDHITSKSDKSGKIMYSPIVEYQHAGQLCNKTCSAKSSAPYKIDSTHKFYLLANGDIVNTTEYKVSTIFLKVFPIVKTLKALPFMVVTLILSSMAVDRLFNIMIAIF